MHQPAGDSFDYSGRKYQKYSSNYITETGYSADTMLDTVTNTVQARFTMEDRALITIWDTVMITVPYSPLLSRIQDHVLYGVRSIQQRCIYKVEILFS
jgi:hypothetical protein